MYNLEFETYYGFGLSIVSTIANFYVSYKELALAGDLTKHVLKEQERVKRE